MGKQIQTILFSAMRPPMRRFIEYLFITNYCHIIEKQNENIIRWRTCAHATDLRMEKGRMQVCQKYYQFEWKPYRNEPSCRRTEPKVWFLWFSFRFNFFSLARDNNSFRIYVFDVSGEFVTHKNRSNANNNQNSHLSSTTLLQFRSQFNAKGTGKKSSFFVMFSAHDIWYDRTKFSIMSEHFFFLLTFFSLSFCSHLSHPTIEAQLFLCDVGYLFE